MELKAILKTRFATWMLAAILAFVMVIAARILITQYQVNQEIASLQEQANRIKKDNEQLSYLIQYYTAAEYEEKQAREKLNLKKEGEVVLGLPTRNENSENEVAIASESNPKKWFNYFFRQD